MQFTKQSIVISYFPMFICNVLFFIIFFNVLFNFLDKKKQYFVVLEFYKFCNFLLYFYFAFFSPSRLKKTFFHTYLFPLYYARKNNL